MTIIFKLLSYSESLIKNKLYTMKLLNMKFAGLATLLILFSGCAQEMEQEETESETNYTEAVAVIHPTEDNDASGVVTFEQTEDGVNVQAEISGLDEGLHGFHIHEFGDCRVDDGTSAGGHYAPDEESEHAAPSDQNRHVGDMGNIEADEDGDATVDIVLDKVSLNGPESILGRGLIIHSGEDDLETQPTGDAGSRLGCGVIGHANPDQD